MTDLPKRVFVVEDEVVVAFEMTDTLEDLGFEVVGPSVHLSDAEKRAETADIDVAFLDVNLGRGKTSAPVANILRERGIPFAYITAYDADQVDFIKPSDRVVKKPVSSPELLSVLETVWSDADK